MNPLLGIAYIAKRYNRPNIVKSLAIKRHRQLNRKWAKEKATVQPVTDPLELTWD